MHSLANLNSYSNESITFSDDRPIDIRYLFDTSVNQTIIIDQDQTHPAQIGNDVVEFVNCGSANVVYRINVGGLANTSVTWDSLPNGVTSSDDNGVYSINGLRLVKDWDQVKSPTITMPSGFFGVWNYTSSIILDGNVEQSWTTTVTANDLLDITIPEVFYYTPGETEVILGVPVFQDTTSNTFTLTTTVSNPAYVANLTVSGTGGNVTSNVTTKTITITAGLEDINNYVANLTLTTLETVEADFTISYSLFNPVSSEFGNVTQDISALTELITFRGEPAYYSTNITGPVLRTPTISDIEANVSKQYVMTISSTEANCVSNLYSTSSNAVSTWFPGNLTLQLAGTRSQINSDLGNLYLTPFTDKDDNFKLNYDLGLVASNIGNVAANRLQSVFIDEIDDEITDMDRSRTFVQNTPALLFTENIPSIEFVEGNPSYTISFNTNAGEFGLNDFTTNSSYSFTGTRDQCNNIFTLLRFYPLRDFLGIHTFTYSQRRNDVLQVTVTVAIIGSARTTPLPDQEIVMLGLGELQGVNLPVLSYTQVNYLNMDVLLVGGGGGGGFRGGGGGGGQVREFIDLKVAKDEFISYTVGAGGEGGRYANGSPGGTTTIFGLSALGGLGGIYGNPGGGPAPFDGRGGAGGGGGNGGAGITNNDAGGWAGGGGGSNGQIGETARIISIPDIWKFKGGNGAPSVFSTITNQFYGGAGGGDSFLGRAGGLSGTIPQEDRLGYGGTATFPTAETPNNGIGGGGNGGNQFFKTPGRFGTPNTGGGGGGGGETNLGIGFIDRAGNGGSGVIALKFYR